MGFDKASLNDFVSGGGASVIFYNTHKNTAATAYVVGKTTSTVATPVPATAHTDAMYVLSLFEDIDFKINEDGTLEATINNDEDRKIFWEFIKKVAIPPATSTGIVGEKKREDGTTYAGAATNSVALTMIAAGPVTPNAPIERKATIALVTLTCSGFKQKSGEMSSPTVTVKSQKLDYDLTIAKGLLDPTLYDTTTNTDVTLTKGAGFEIAFLKPKA